MNKKKVLTILIATIAIALVVEVLFNHPHVYEWYHGVIGFDILFGFFGSALLIIVAKVILGPIIQKPEDYYDEGGEDDRD